MIVTIFIVIVIEEFDIFAFSGVLIYIDGFMFNICWCGFDFGQYLNDIIFWFNQVFVKNDVNIKATSFLRVNFLNR